MKSPSTPTSSSGAPAFDRQDLPVSFQPRPMDVIIGRGKQVNKHNDKNGILQDLLQTFAGDYLYGKKERKSELLTIVVQEIRATGCAFIKKESPATAPSSSSSGGKPVFRWYSVDETAARNSAAQFLRNHLSENYKSSKQFKKKLRMDKKKKTTKATRNASVVSTTSSSSDGTPSMTSSSGSSQSSLASCEQEEMPLSIHQINSSSKSSNYSPWKLANNEDAHYEQQQTDSLVSLLPPHRASRHLKESDYDCSFPTNTTTRRVSGTYHSKLLSGAGFLDDEASPFDDMDAIMNMDLSSTTTQDLFEPRPIGSVQCQPGTNHGSVFQSTEDEDLFLSWSSSVL